LSVLRGYPTRLRKETFVGCQAIELQKGELGRGDLQSNDRTEADSSADEERQLSATGNTGFWLIKMKEKTRQRVLDERRWRMWILFLAANTATVGRGPRSHG